MKKQLSTPGLTFILLLSSGVIFPILFSMTDKLLRTLMADLNPIILLICSFCWLLVMYFYGIKFSLEYIQREFEIANTNALFTYGNVGFMVISAIFYASLISASWLSNSLWGLFYLTTMLFFYILSSKILKQENISS